MTKKRRHGATLPVFHPIGVVKNQVRTKIEEGWGGIQSRIVLRKKYAAGLQGVEDFSHALVIFWLHQADQDAEPLRLVRHPRGYAHLPLVGIFAQRAKRRINPIGVTVVRILKKRGATLYVSGLDAINGTPVLDIKPYFPIFDRPEQFRVPPWVAPAMNGYFERS